MPSDVQFTEESRPRDAAPHDLQELLSSDAALDMVRQVKMRVVEGITRRWRLASNAAVSRQHQQQRQDSAQHGSAPRRA
jgi:hypothetical protein